MYISATSVWDSLPRVGHIKTADRNQAVQRDQIDVQTKQKRIAKLKNNRNTISPGNVQYAKDIAHIVKNITDTTSTKQGSGSI